jgi:hypothetical protein
MAIDLAAHGSSREAMFYALASKSLIEVLIKSLSMAPIDRLRIVSRRAAQQPQRVEDARERADGDAPQTREPGYVRCFNQVDSIVLLRSSP